MSAQVATSETSKKLKAAIRAKLEELGVYVDDELPDYIMVMIANKKEKSQMKDDLGLFIGKSTAKFVDWLFDLFDRLTNASSKQAEDTKRAEEEERQRRHHEEERQKEREREHEKEREREREREKEKERERKKEREREEEKEREKKRERENRRRDEKPKRRRSRSNTYSDEEDRKRSRSERRVVSTVVQRQKSKSPEQQKVQSTVVVKRSIRSSGDKANAKARSSMFLKAMNEASVSAGYAPRKSVEEKNNEHGEDDDMSDLDALPSKTEEKTKKKKSLKERMKFKKSRHGHSENDDEEDNAVVLNNLESSRGGPQMIIKLAGGEEAIKKLRVHDRIVVPENNDRSRLKRKIQNTDNDDDDNRKHQRIVFDLTPSPAESSPSAADSPTLKKWDGQIDLAQESETSDEEAEIDALLAETRGYYSKNREDDEQLPPTHQLSGSNFSLAPAYIPTPIHQLQENQHQGPKERCIFWPKCTKGDICQFHHPVKNCTTFPKCSFGPRCLFIHPTCRYDKFCTKKQCPYLHYGTGGVQPATSSGLPLTTNKLTANFFAPSQPQQAKPAEQIDAAPQQPKVGVLSSIAAKLVASVKKSDQSSSAAASSENVVAEPKVEDESKPAEQNKESPEKVVQKPAPPPAKPVTDAPIAPLQAIIPCRFAAACRNPGCHFKHPKECKFGANCRNSYCYFYHKPAAPPVQNSEALAKFKWTAAAAAATTTTSA